MKNPVLLATLLVLLLNNIGYSQESKFGNKWPTLQKCLEFSKETGLWIRTEFKQPRRTYVYKFNKDGTFAVAWTEVVERVNRFGRRKSTSQKFLRKGRWKLEHRRITAEEHQALATYKTNIGPIPQIKVHFLTLTFIGNDETIRTLPEKSSRSINGTAKIALSEFPNKGNRVVSSLTSLIWVTVSMSPEFDCAPYPRTLLRNQKGVNYVTWEHG